jgi:hypothetical protein
LAVQPGDPIICPAARAQVIDPDWSRRKLLEPFTWSQADELNMSLLPEPDDSSEFLYLYGLSSGSMGLEARDGACLECSFDLRVFPCCWYFALHGGPRALHQHANQREPGSQGGFLLLLAAG